MVSAGLTVSVVATVFNEASSIHQWLDALLAQSRLPDEIIIVDGGSSDGTVELIKDRISSAVVPIHCISSPGANISQGRNIAIERAQGDIIAVTDAGTRADSCWLERLIQPLMTDDADVASGFFVPKAITAWERALAATTLPDVAEIDSKGFLPSSRSMAFRRRWFDIGLRYPEWLDYCEDLVWDLKMRRSGARFTFVLDAVVTFDVRPSPRSYSTQYFRYARGDGKAGLFSRRHALRYGTYLGLGVVAWRRRQYEWFVTCLMGVAYVRKPIVRLWNRDRQHGVSPLNTVVLIPNVIWLRALGDVAKMAGYPTGVVWRVRRFGALGPRTTWKRISPNGTLHRPAEMSRETPEPEVSPSAESHEEPR